MALRTRSRLCCSQRVLLLFPFVLLFLTISVIMISTVRLPNSPPAFDQLPSQALSSAGGVRASVRGSPPTTNIHSGAWKATPKRLIIATKHSEHVTSTASIDAHAVPDTSHAGSRRKKHKGNGIASKRQERPDVGQDPTDLQHSLLPKFTVNSTLPRHRIKLGTGRAVGAPSSKTHNHLAKSQTTALNPSPGNTPIRDRKQAGRQADRWSDGRTNLQTKNSHHKDGWGERQEKRHADAQVNSRRNNSFQKQKHATRHSGTSDKTGKEQAVKSPPRNLKKQHNFSMEQSEITNLNVLEQNKAFSKFKAVKMKGDRRLCQSYRPQDFPDTDQRRIRMSLDRHALPWLSDDDIQKIELLAMGEVVSKARVPAHGQVLQVALNYNATNQRILQTFIGPKKDPSTHDALKHRVSGSHSECCQHGSCSLVKRAEDWYEVFAFHLDRVLGLNRSLPAVLRTFHSDVLPYKYTSGTPRPAVWWDPDIQHLADRDNDQNSVPLSWVQYQEILKVHCGKAAGLNTAPCVGVHHSEWGRLALFDFLLQVNDRLDRCCCGFRPGTKETCVENLLHAKCQNTKELVLVHILVRKVDTSRMVFIDNAGRPHQPADNLNFRLVEGIEEFPEKAVSVLQSGCLESLLLHSLYTDREFWDGRGGVAGLGPLIRTVEQRGKVLLRHIRDKKLRLNRDL